MRGLRDKYLLGKDGGDRNSADGDDSELPRGRPTLLGKYDKLVGDCVQDLVGAGEAKLTSFLVIATAKQARHIILYRI